MLYEIVSSFPNDIIFETEGPFISLYQPTYRFRPANKQDVIRFRNLVQQIQNSLSQKYSKEEVGKLLKPFEELAENKLFWNHTKDGLCILSSKNKTIVYTLNREVKEIAIVADSFHIKPLLRVFQSADRYHLLGVNKKDFVLYEGDRYGFNKIDLGQDIPQTIEEVLGDQYTESYLSSGSYSGAGTPMFHGHGGRKDEVKKDTEKYFRYIDKLVLDKFSNVEKIPMVLMALTENQGIFRSISSNNFLIEEGLKKDYESLDKDEIRKEAWNILEPLYINKTKEVVDKFKEGQAQFLASDDVSQVVRAGFEGRIEMLILESDKLIPGKIDKENGEIISGPLDDPSFDDLLDDLAELVLRTRGNILILPKDRMPSHTGVAAIFKYEKRKKY